MKFQSTLASSLVRIPRNVHCHPFGACPAVVRRCAFTATSCLAEIGIIKSLYRNMVYIGCLWGHLDASGSRATRRSAGPPCLDQSQEAPSFECASNRSIVQHKLHVPEELGNHSRKGIFGGSVKQVRRTNLARTYA